MPICSGLNKAAEAMQGADEEAEGGEVFQIFEVLNEYRYISNIFISS